MNKHLQEIDSATNEAVAEYKEGLSTIYRFVNTPIGNVMISIQARDGRSGYMVNYTINGSPTNKGRLFKLLE